jgi:ATP-dependent Zn protease
MRRWVKRLTVVVTVVLLALFVQALVSPRDHTGSGGDMPLSSVLATIDSRQVTRAKISSDHVVLTLSDGHKLSGRFPPVYASRLVDLLHEQKATIQFERTNGWVTLLTYLLPLLPFAFFWAWLARRLPRPADPASPTPPASREPAATE